MILVLPISNSTLSSVLHEISEQPLSQIMNYFKEVKAKYGDAMTVVRLPKFKISTKLSLVETLRDMGVKDVFDLDSADLSGISVAPLYVSSILHKTEIEVDEDGTTGSAATVVEIVEKSFPAGFRADKPFAFFVVDKVTATVIFLGTVYNPNV